MPETEALMGNLQDDFPQISDGDVDDDILLPIEDPNAAAGSKGGHLTRGQLLKDAVRDDGAGVVAALEITALTSGTHTISTSLSFATGGASITRLLTAQDSVSIATIGAGADDDTATLTVTGAASGDFVLVQIIGTAPPGLHLHGYVSAADTVTIEAYNSTASSITGASYTIRAMVMRFA